MSAGGRALAASDLAAFRRLRRAALAAEPAAFGSSPQEDAALTDEAVLARVTEPHAVFGAFAGGVLVGSAGFALSRRSRRSGRRFSVRTADRRSRGAKRRHRGLLWGVHVAPAHRGGGLGRALVEAVVAHASGRVLILEAAVAAGNPAARALDAALGSAPYGLHRRALGVGDAFHDEVLLALDPPRT